MAKRKRTISAGPLVQTVVYTVPGPRDTEKTRAARHDSTTAAQKALNTRAAFAKLEMLLAGNFSGNDLFATLTYSDTNYPKNRSEARKNIRAFIRLLRAARQRRGKTLKYIYTTEGLHGDHRIHHHMVIQAAGSADLETICSLWRFGNADVIRISEHYTESSGAERYINYEKLARYIAKEKPEDRPNGAQMWTGSKNLVPPVVKSCIIPENETVETPVGAIEISRQEYSNQYSSFRFVKYVYPISRTTPFYKRA